MNECLKTMEEETAKHIKCVKQRAHCKSNYKHSCTVHVQGLVSAAEWWYFWLPNIFNRPLPHAIRVKCLNFMCAHHERVCVCVCRRFYCEACVRIHYNWKLEYCLCSNLFLHKIVFILPLLTLTLHFLVSFFIQ